MPVCRQENAFLVEAVKKNGYADFFGTEQQQCFCRSNGRQNGTSLVSLWCVLFVFSILFFANVRVFGNDLVQVN